MRITQDSVGDIETSLCVYYKTYFKKTRHVGYYKQRMLNELETMAKKGIYL